MDQNQKDFFIILGGLAIIVLLVIIALAGVTRLKATGYVGLIQIQGLILEDRSINKQLHQLNDNSLVRTLVLYINSNGGTLAAAQSIFEEIQKIRQGGKPVVVAMGEVCTSGGYYIACGADRIFANPGSVTGSIGVILRYPEVGALLQKLGLRMEVIKSGDFKDLGDIAHRMKPAEQQILQQVIDDMHEQFVDMVMDRRSHKLALALSARQKQSVTDLIPAAVADYLRGLADGRIFTGRQAFELGLVDELGNLDDAVKTAAHMAGIHGRPKVIQQRSPSFWKQLFYGTLSSEISGSNQKIPYQLWLDLLLAREKWEDLWFAP